MNDAVELLRRGSVVAAPSLLGAIVTSEIGGAVVRLRITEVEAYRQDDPASHTFRGLSTRNSSMFEAAGHIYVYRHMGLHHCMNFVTGEAGVGEGILIRAGQIIDGLDVALGRRRQRGTCRHERDLARGPARLTTALGVDLTLNGAQFTVPGAPVTLTLGDPVDLVDIATGPRVGVSGPGADPGTYPWRFWVRGDETVSDFKPGTVRRERKITAH